MSLPTEGYPDCMRDLIEEFAHMPGIGVRTAERLAFYVLSADKDSIGRLSDSIRKVKESIHYCSKCYNLSEHEECRVCSDASRNQGVICVVEDPKDIITIEKVGVYKGLYHVLLGSLSPLEGIGPEDLKIKELMTRAKKVTEVLLATAPDTEGEATAIYLTKLLKAQQIKVTRLAQGIPVGCDLEFADRATLMHAIEARHEL
jgi:recombination protein RecR